MVQFNISYDTNVSLEQRIGFEMASAIWSSFLKDDIEVNLHIGASSGLDNAEAVGGAIPIFHRQNYGIFQEYYAQDASSDEDSQAANHLQQGNTVDLKVGDTVVEKNSDILLTSAQAKALGMDKSIQIENGTTWNRDLASSDGLDGYIVISNAFDWSYDFTRSAEASEGTLDFLSMALHEIGHNLGFVSGIDGTIDVETLYSGKTQVSDFTALDLFRHSVETTEIDNIDGSVSSVTVGESAYFSIDGGQTNLGNFSTGSDTAQGGDGFQASHWQRLQTAMGIMDPTLAYKERLKFSKLDLQAMDVLGWDVNYDQLNDNFDLETILKTAEVSVAESLGLDSTLLTEQRGENHLYTMGYNQWWQIFESQMLEMGYNQWWQLFEMGYNQWWQQQEDPEAFLEMGYNQWWQAFEDQIIEMGYNQWWQEFEQDMLEMGYNQWWQVFEMGYNQWWQKLDTFFSTLENSDSTGQSSSNANSGLNEDYGSSEASVVVSGGEADDILSGSTHKDLVSGGGGDDIIDGRAGDDQLLGNNGQDILYGFDGDDAIYGGQGDDFVSGENGHDQLFGEEGADILSGGAGNDLIDGGEGKDLLKGGYDDDVLHGRAGNDDISGESGDDIAIGGEGNDILSGGHGNDYLYGDFFQSTDAAGESSLEEIAQSSGLAEQTAAPLVDFWVRLEAEEMSQSNYQATDVANASGGSLVTTGGRGKLKSEFSGPEGLYNIVVGYHDQKDGQGDIELKIGNGRDAKKFEWDLGQIGDSNGINSKTFVTYTIRNVSLSEGDRIELASKASGKENIAIDYIDIVSLSDSEISDNAELLDSAELYDGSLYFQNSDYDKEEAKYIANALGGTYIEKVSDRTAEDFWLENTFEEAKNVIKVDVSSQQLNVLTDAGLGAIQNNIRLEAEDFTLSSGFEIDDDITNASGKGIIKDKGKSNQSPTATSIFTEESGTYDIFVGYIDGEEGTASASISINGIELDQWRFSADTDIVEYRTVGQGITLQTGDIIEIEGHQHKKDEAQIDFIDFVLSDHSDTVETAEAESFRLEAESLSWDGDAKQKTFDSASNGSTIEAKKQTVAYTTFTGESGLYDISVGYDDEGKGSAQLGIEIEGTELDFWQLQTGIKKTISSQTLATGIYLNKGDEFKFFTGSSNNKFFLDYVDFLAVEENAQSGDSSTDGGSAEETFRIEAESFQLSSKTKIKNNDLASGEAYLEVGTDSLSSVGSTLFMGETGYYDISVTYYDFGKDEGELALNVNEERLGQWRTDESSNSSKSLSSTAVTRTVASSVYLTHASDVLQLFGRKEGEDKGNIDYIELTRVSSPQDKGTDVLSGMGENADILRGGQGNDVLYGGEGNDTLYGEDEFDNGLGSAESNSDVLYGENGDDTLYGNSGNDRLSGGAGNDTVSGGLGDDTIDGTDDLHYGNQEIDKLLGGGGSDRFVLGNASHSYYLSSGDSDYAEIADFDASQDILQLHGSSEDYSQSTSADGLRLFKGQDLVAHLIGVSELDIDSSAVEFV